MGTGEKSVSRQRQHGRQLLLLEAMRPEPRQPGETRARLITALFVQHTARARKAQFLCRALMSSADWQLRLNTVNYRVASSKSQVFG